MGRTILGILAGLVVAWLAMTICEFASLFLHRPPAGFDLRDPQALAAHIAAAPLSAMLVVVIGWVLAAFVGGWVAARIARHSPGRRAGHRRTRARRCDRQQRDDSASAMDDGCWYRVALAAGVARCTAGAPAGNGEVVVRAIT